MVIICENPCYLRHLRAFKTASSIIYPSQSALFFSVKLCVLRVSVLKK